MAGVGAGPQSDRNQEATIYIGDLDGQVEEPLLWEIMVQVGPVVSVHIPKDKLTAQSMGFGFVEFKSEVDAEYAVKVMNMIKLFGKPIRVNKSARDRDALDAGANLFIGNLDPEVDEKLLYDTFSAFGTIMTTPKVMRDQETGTSRGFGFVNFDSFEASDAAIEAMSGQFLCNKPITVCYALKKDSKTERHGNEEDVDLRPTAVCFLDFEIDAAPAGRVTIELYGNAVPRTVANFKDLAVGKPGFGYKGTSVYRVVNGLTIQAGDIVRDDGTSGRSIYGESFERESFRVPHSGEGFVSMVNSPAGTVDSRFLIDTRADGSQYLDGKYVGFGRVKDGMEIVHKIEALPTTGTKNAPRAHVVIANSGVLP